MSTPKHQRRLLPSIKSIKDEWPACFGFALAIGWLALQVVPGRAAGVTGNDPSTYVQMAHDLARQGSVLHRFECMREVAAAGLNPALLAPAGYLSRDPADLTLTAPLYPIGWPLLLSLAYRLGGDDALFWTLPLLALVCAGLLWWVARAFLSDTFAPGLAAAGATWTFALTLTVREQVAFSLSPMSDMPAQAFSLLALALAILAARRQSLPLVVLSGLALGYGYLVRHVVLLMAAPVAWTVWRGFGPRGRVRPLIALSLGAASIVAPELLDYHQRILGGLLTPESPDSLTFQPGLVVPTLQALIARPESFGPPFALFWSGLVVLIAVRRLRSLAVTLLLWTVPLVGFHAGLTFTASFGNVVRYNLPALPAIALVSSLPLVWMGDRLAACRWPGHVSRVIRLALGVIGPLALLWNRPDSHFIAYGFLDSEGRASYASLSETLPANAVVLTDDQHAGAIAMYADLAVARPQYWSSGEFEAFLDAMRAAHHPVLTLGTPAYPLDFLWQYSPQPTGTILPNPPDGGDGVVHRVP